ncbi:MAG: nicotinate phosphoribosyltransferase [Sandaracinaceae bacterium]|nr:nicotinate phosphoribosyltransferase [Sandaracinaceae bacterium]
MVDVVHPQGLALLTDLYELTMACAHHRVGSAEELASFSLFFRRPPFGGSYVVAAGIDDAVSILESLRFEESDLAYLASLRRSDGEVLFDESFLEILRNFEFRCDIDAVEEGEIVFAQEPLVRVTGPVWQAQLAEGLLLNLIGFESLVATKASRVVQAARGKPVIEFGLRRAHGPNGALSASRAAFIGGCVATSNVLAGKVFGIPVKGTHAHSWVQFFADEKEAFSKLAQAFGQEVVYLVDTYEVAHGIRHALQVAQKAGGLMGIRLDSGDLLTLSRRVRVALDNSGFQQAQIIASGDLDEYLIDDLLSKGAPIDAFGVGTRLVTGGQQAAIGCVYKLTAVYEGGRFVPRFKRSEDPDKRSIPGRIEVERCMDQEGAFLFDWLWDADDLSSRDGPLCNLEGEHLSLPPPAQIRLLLSAAMRQGKRVRPFAPLEAAQKRARKGLASLPPPLRSLDAFERGERPPVMVRAPFWEKKEALLRNVERGS